MRRFRKWGRAKEEWESDMTPKTSLEESQVSLRQRILISVTQVVASDCLSLGNVPESHLPGSWGEEILTPFVFWFRVGVLFTTDFEISFYKEGYSYPGQPKQTTSSMAPCPHTHCPHTDTSPSCDTAKPRIYTSVYLKTCFPVARDVWNSLVVV